MGLESVIYKFFYLVYLILFKNMKVNMYNFLMKYIKILIVVIFKGAFMDFFF